MSYRDLPNVAVKDRFDCILNFYFCCYIADTVLVVLSITLNDTKEFTNDSVRLETIVVVVVDTLVYYVFPIEL